MNTININNCTPILLFRYGYDTSIFIYRSNSNNNYRTLNDNITTFSSIHALFALSRILLHDVPRNVYSVDCIRIVIIIIIPQPVSTINIKRYVQLHMSAHKTYLKLKIKKKIQNACTSYRVHFFRSLVLVTFAYRPYTCNTRNAAKENIQKLIFWKVSNDRQKKKTTTNFV